MTDAELAALANAVRTAPEDPAPRLRWAAALERFGRRDEALAALVPVAWTSAGARAAIAAYPCWSSAGGGPGRAGWLDVPPVPREPRVLWTRDVGARALVANAYAVVVLEPGGVARVLDAATGAERHAFPAAGPIELAGDVVLSEAKPHLEARDLGTGELLWSEAVLAPEHPHPGWEVRWLTTGPWLLLAEPYSVEARLLDPRRGPGRRAWTSKCSPVIGDLGPESRADVIASGRTVYVFEAWPNGSQLRALVNGRVAWKREGYPHPRLADEAVAVGVSDDFHLGRQQWLSSVVARSASGDARWLESDERIVAASLLAPSVVGVHVAEGAVLLDRATATPRSRVRRATLLAGARDATYAVTSRGVARLLGSDVAVLETPSRPSFLAAAPSRVFAWGDEGTACIG